MFKQRNRELIPAHFLSKATRAGRKRRALIARDIRENRKALGGREYNRALLTCEPRGLLRAA